MNVVYAPANRLGGYERQSTQRSEIQCLYERMLMDDPGARARILDVGCGTSLQPFFRGLRARCRQYDGVDIDPGVMDHPLLDERWNATLEDANLPSSAYDMAFSYNVVEHIAKPRPFLQKIRSVLKPGASFWALTPHAAHPFCRVTRTLDVLGVKKYLAKSKEGWNEYPSYYRMNRPHHVLRDIENLGFASATFYFMPSVAWDSYFPAPLRFIPSLYDRFLGSRYRSFMLLLIYRLQAA